jgi:chromate reductase
MEIAIADIRSIPLFNQDLDKDGERPDAVETLKAAVHNADGVLIATPEYSHSVPGVLKNTLDWLARPGQGLGRPMTSKPTGIIGAAPGGSGSMRAQDQLTIILMAMLAFMYPNGGVAVSRAGDKFDDEMKLTDEKTIEFLRKYLTGFADWVRR